jgi:HEAT repeat protein
MRKPSAAFVAVLALLSGCRAKESPANVPALIEDLKGADKEKSGQANLALIRVGAPATPALVELLGTSDPRLRFLALTTLWGMGARAESAVPTLAETLADPDPEIRNGAAMALANMGPAAAPAVPALIKALSDGESRVRQTAVKALGNIGPAARDAVPVITGAVKRGAWPEAEDALRQIQGRPVETPSPSPEAH